MKTYIGKGKLGDYDNIQVSIEVAKIPKELITEYKGKKYLNFTVSPMKQTDQYGKTHTVYIWQPDKEQSYNPPTEHEIAKCNGYVNQYENEEETDSNIPF
jgi:hypothetical protein